MSILDQAASSPLGIESRSRPLAASVKAGVASGRNGWGRGLLFLSWAAPLLLVTA
jgi:hypothetical protein